MRPVQSIRAGSDGPVDPASFSKRSLIRSQRQSTLSSAERARRPRSHKGDRMDKGHPPRRPRSEAPDQDDIFQIDPRRKYKRRATDSLSELKDSGSENESGSMSDSEEHELGPLGSDDDDVDEETGLTGKERQKYLQRKRRKDGLDTRIGGGGGVSKEEARKADRNVVRTMLFNAVLIGLWYLFSLSISIVSHRSVPRWDAG